MILLVANVHYLGRAFGGFREWTCSGCNAGIYSCPGKRQLQLVSVPSTYAAHSHDWVLMHDSVPDWAAWKPWLWLAYILGPDKATAAPADPHAIFPAAHVNMRFSDIAGLRTLANDDHYANRAEALALVNADVAPTTAPAGGKSPGSHTP